MKKIISLLATMIVLVCAVFALASCGVSVKDAEQDPHGVITEAFTQTNAQFFKDDANVGSIVEDSLKSGSVKLDFKGTNELSTILGPSYADMRVKAVLYSDKKNDKYAFDVVVKVDSLDVEGTLYMSPEEVVLDCPALVGSENAYKLNMTGLAQDFNGSGLYEWITEQFGAIPTESLDKIKSLLETFSEVYADLYEEDEDEAKDFALDIYKSLGLKVQEDTVKIDDKDVNVIKIQLSVNNKTCEAIVKEIADELFEDDEMRNNFVSSLMDKISSYEIDVKVDVNIDKGNKRIASIVANGAAANADGSETGIEMNFTVTDNKMEFKGGINSNDLASVFYVTLTREQKDDIVTYVVNAKGGSSDDGTTPTMSNLLKAEFEYNKKDGDFKVGIKANGTTVLSIEGNIKKTSDTATIKINEVGSQGLSLEVDLTIEYKKGDKMPSAPKAKDILQMSKAEVETAIQDIFMNSIFADIFQSAE